MRQFRRQRSSPKATGQWGSWSPNPGASRVCCPLLSQLKIQRADGVRASQASENRRSASTSEPVVSEMGWQPASCSRGMWEEMRSLWAFPLPEFSGGLAWAGLYCCSSSPEPGNQPVPGKPRVEQTPSIAQKAKARQNSVSGKDPGRHMGRHSFYFVRETVILML